MWFLALKTVQPSRAATSSCVRSSRYLRRKAAASDVSWPAVSQNLRVLKNSGLLVERREGTHRYYRVDRRALGPLEVILRQMWTRDLGRLKQAAEQEARTRRRRNA